MEEQSKSPWQIWKESLKNKEPQFWDALSGNADKASEELADSRYEICKSCPEFIGLTKQCKKCGCFMNVKTKLKHADCPIHKWDIEKILVSVVNYCDPEFYETIKSLWDNASNKDRLIFSIVSQDIEKHNFDFIPTNQLIYRYFDMSKWVGGICAARNLAVDVNVEYEYFIQFDSHTIATEGWDSKAIRLYRSLGDQDKYIVSSGTPSYVRNQEGNIETGMGDIWGNRAVPSDHVVPGFFFPYYAAMQEKEKVEGFWVTCLFLIAPYEWVKEVGISKDSSYNTEEFNLSLRSHAKGWKIFNKGHRVVFHQWHDQNIAIETRRNKRPWADKFTEEYWKHAEKATNFTGRLIAGLEDVPLDKVKSFFKLANINEKYCENPDNYYNILDQTKIDNKHIGMPPRFPK